jgi:single-strand DNA-binding protein
MKGMNRVTLVGNTGKDPELKQLADGVMVATISLATTDLFRNKDGTTGADTQWHTVVFWRGLADLAGKYVKKGSLILVEGRIRYRKYEDKEAVMRYKTEIVGEELILLDRKDLKAGSSEAELKAEDLPF